MAGPSSTPRASPSTPNTIAGEGAETHSRLWDDDDARNWSLTVEAVHKHGALIGAELIAIGGASGYEFPAAVAGGQRHRP